MRETFRSALFTVGTMVVLLGGSVGIGYALRTLAGVTSLWVLAPVNMLFGVGVALSLWRYLLWRSACAVRAERYAAWGIQRETKQSVKAAAKRTGSGAP